jgi:hypothetical protein
MVGLLMGYNYSLLITVFTSERPERGGPAFVETGINGDSKRTKEMGPFSVGSV